MDNKQIAHNIERIVRWITTKSVTGYSCDWTQDNSLLSVVIIGDNHVYLETFFEDDKEEETCVSIYKNEEHQLSFGGTFDEAIAEANSHIN